MSYKIESGTKDIVISGFEKGIADDPFDGISNLINTNITSVPGQATVNFATSQISPPVIPSGSVISSNAGTDYFTYTGAAGLENYMTIIFSAQSGTGVSLNTAYWIINLNGAGAGTFQLTTDYAQTSIFNVTGNGTGTFRTANIAIEPITTAGTGQPKFFTYDEPDAAYFLLTTAGALWSNIKTTTSGYWTYCGPSGTTAGLNQGAGLAYIQSTIPSNGQYNSYIIVFRNTTIDYFIVKSAGVQNLQWVFGWTPSDGTASHATVTLNTNTSIHNAYFGQDNVLYWCDGSFLGSIFETPDGPPQTIILDLSNTAKYTYAFQALELPTLDNSQCLAELGTNLLIGGQNNAIYPWDRISTSFRYPILIAEYNIQQLVTVNTNTYIFAGNRGRIYLTNGSQAQLYKKIPDHISGTIEPYYTWGGATSQKNQLYFSFLATTNAGVTLNNYGGVWGIDLDTKAIRMTNTFSYQTTTYNGYALGIIPNFSQTASGTGLYIGWDSGAGTRGIDTTITAPYAGGTAVAVGIVDSDLIPIGTFLNPTTNGQVEFKLSVPLVSGESIQLYYRQKFSDNFTAINSSQVGNGLFTAVGTYSGVCQSVNFEQSQWIQIRAVIISTAVNPTYTRLTELRLRDAK